MEISKSARVLIAAVIALVAACSTAADLTDRYLANLESAEAFHLTEIMVQSDSVRAHSIVFDAAGGSVDRDRREIRGVNLQGTPVATALADIVWMRVKMESGDGITYVSLRLDAVLDRPTWPPRGPVLRAALVAGTVIEFSGMAPEVLAPTRALRWIAHDQREVLLPLARAVWIEHDRCDGSTPEVATQPRGVPASATMRSGEVVEMLGRDGRLDLDLERVSCQEPEWDAPLSTVSIVRVEVPPVVAPPPVEPIADQRFAALNDLDADQRVRIKTVSRDADWTAGEFMGFRDGEVFLRTENDSLIAVAAGDLLEFQVDEGPRSNSGTVAVIGACVGGGVGGVIGAGLANMTIMGDSNDTSVGGALAAGVMVGALIGGLLGAGLGSLSSAEAFTDLETFEKSRPADPPDDDVSLGFGFGF